MCCSCRSRSGQDFVPGGIGRGRKQGRIDGILRCLLLLFPEMVITAVEIPPGILDDFKEVTEVVPDVQICVCIDIGGYQETAVFRDDELQER